MREPTGRGAGGRLPFDPCAVLMRAGGVIAEIRELGIALFVREIFIASGAMIVRNGAGVQAVRTGNGILKRHIVAEGSYGLACGPVAAGALVGGGACLRTGGRLRLGYKRIKRVRRGGKARLDGFIGGDIGIAAPAVEGIVIRGVRGFGLRGGRRGAAAVIHGLGAEHRTVFRLEGYGIAVDGGVAHGDVTGGGDAGYRVGDHVAALAARHRAGGGGNRGHAAVGVASGKRDLERGAAVIRNAGSGILGYGVARAGAERYVGVPARVEGVGFGGVRGFIPDVGGGSVGFIVLGAAGGSGSIVIPGKGIAAAGGRGGKCGHRRVVGGRDAVRAAGAAVLVQRYDVGLRLPYGVQRKVRVAGVRGAGNVGGGGCAAAGAPAEEVVSLAGGRGGGERIGLIHEFIRSGRRVLAAVGVEGDFIYFFNAEGHVAGTGTIPLYTKQVGSACRELLAHKEVAVAARKA